MQHQPYYCFNSTLKRINQEILWDAVNSSVDRQLPKLIERAKDQDSELGTLTLDPNFQIPTHQKAVDIHCMPGASQGLAKLTRNSAMDNQARIHSQNMANGKVPFGHTGFSERVKAIKATGIPYSSAGENVAYNQGYSDPATIAVQGWLKSPGHLANIRGNFNKTGIGVASNSRGEIYFTQIFLR